MVHLAFVDYIKRKRETLILKRAWPERLNIVDAAIDMLLRRLKGRAALQAVRRLTTAKRDLRTELLDSALLNVGALGWTDVALAKAARDIGLSPLNHGLASRGAVDIVLHFLKGKRAHVFSLMQQSAPPPGPEVPPGLGVREELMYRAIAAHLDYLQPYRNSWPSALALLAAPQNVLDVLDTVGDLADDLCTYAGTTPTRGDWYTDRAHLLSLYCCVELYFLTDSSEDLLDTKSFLRRILKIRN